MKNIFFLELKSYNTVIEKLNIKGSSQITTLIINVKHAIALILIEFIKITGNSNFINKYKLYLPFSKEVSKKSVDCLLKIQITMNIKIPHFWWHLYEQINHWCWWSEYNFGILCNNSTGNPVALRPHFIHLTSDCPSTIFNFFI